MNCMTPRAFGALGPVAPGTGAAFHGLAAPGPFRGAPYAGLAAPGPFRGSAAYGGFQSDRPGAASLVAGMARAPELAPLLAQHSTGGGRAIALDNAFAARGQEVLLQSAIGAGAALATGIALAAAGEPKAAQAVGAVGVMGALGYFVWQSGLGAKAGLAAPGPFRGAAYGAAKTGPGAQAMQSAAQSGRLRMPPVAEAEAQHVFDKVADVKRGATNPQAALQAAIGAGAAVAAGLAVAIAGEREAAVAVGAAGVFGALGYYMWQSGLAGDLVRG